MNSQNQPGTIRRLVRHMRQPREMAWAFGSSFWLAGVTYWVAEAKGRGVLTGNVPALVVTLVGFGGFLLLQSIKAYQDVQREERTARTPRLDVPHETVE